MALGRALLGHALRGDTAAVGALTLGPQPARWLAIALEHDSALVRAWTEEPEVNWTARSGDTTVVRWWTRGAGPRCLHPGPFAGSGELWVAVKDTGGAGRVVRLASPCVSEAPPPIEFTIDTAGSPPTGPREEKHPR